MTEEVQTRGPDEMYCSSCGALIKRGVQFCPQCGTSTGSAPGSVPSAGRAGVPATVEEGDVAGAGRYILNFFLAGLIGVGLTYFLRNQGWLATWISGGIFVLIIIAVAASS